MTNSFKPDPDLTQDAFEGEATAWFARQRSGDMSLQETQAFEAWLQADDRHRLAFEAVESVWLAFGRARDAPEILKLRAQARRSSGAVMRWVGAACAAVVALAVLTGGGAWTSFEMKQAPWAKYPDQTFRTDVGQRSTVILPDGSTVILNTDTVLRTRSADHERVLFLDRGQALFRVAKDARHPFVVHAAGRTVTALGTVFDIRAGDHKFVVTLVEGRVRVEQPSRLAASAGRTAGGSAPRVQAAELVAGAQLTAGDGDRWSVAPTDTAEATAWRTGWLKFDNAELGQVVEELSRYSERKIVLQDPRLASLRISGRFKAGDVDGFLRAAALYDIRVVAPNDPGSERLALVIGDKNVDPVQGYKRRDPLNQ